MHILGMFSRLAHRCHMSVVAPFCVRGSTAAFAVERVGEKLKSGELKETPWRPHGIDISWDPIWGAGMRAG